MDDDFQIPGAGYDAAYGGMGMDMGMGMGMGMDDLETDLPEENPTLKIGEEREIGNNNLRKKLLKEGEGWENPTSRDEVEGTYSIVY